MLLDIVITIPGTITITTAMIITILGIIVIAGYIIAAIAGIRSTDNHAPFSVMILAFIMLGMSAVVSVILAFVIGFAPEIDVVARVIWCIVLVGSAIFDFWLIIAMNIGLAS